MFIKIFFGKSKNYSYLSSGTEHFSRKTIFLSSAFNKCKVKTALLLCLVLMLASLQENPDYYHLRETVATKINQNTQLIAM